MRQALRTVPSVPVPRTQSVPAGNSPVYYPDDSEIENLDVPPVTGWTHTHNLPRGSSAGVTCQGPPSLNSTLCHMHASQHTLSGPRRYICPPPTVPTFSTIPGGWQLPRTSDWGGNVTLCKPLLPSQANVVPLQMRDVGHGVLLSHCQHDYGQTTLLFASTQLHSVSVPPTTATRATRLQVLP